MKIRAKFIGTDKRKKRIYKTGVKYTLNFDTVPQFNTTKDKIEIQKWVDWEAVSVFWYPSLKKFLENWQIL